MHQPVHNRQINWRPIQHSELRVMQQPCVNMFTARIRQRFNRTPVGMHVEKIVRIRSVNRAIWGSILNHDRQIHLFQLLPLQGIDRVFSVPNLPTWELIFE